MLPRDLTGIWGEFAVHLELSKYGYEVEWQGGSTKNRDMIARRRDREVWVQVKTTSRSDAAIFWRGSGDRARAWGAVAHAAGAAAWFAFVHFPTKARAELAHKDRKLTVYMPEDARVTVAAPSEFADAVDGARLEYASGTRQRRGRNGEEVGDKLPADGLQYPAYATEFTPLERSELAGDSYFIRRIR